MGFEVNVQRPQMLYLLFCLYIVQVCVNKVQLRHHLMDQLGSDMPTVVGEMTQKY